MTGTKNYVCRRVVVTGMGLVTPVGIGVQTTWDALLQGISGISRITSFDASAYPCQIAGEVKDFDPLTYIDKKDVKRMDRFTQFALASASMALETAALAISPEQAHRYGCLLGVGCGGMATLERNHESLLRAGPQRISPFFVPMLIANMASGHVCMRFGLRGPHSCVTTGCAAGTHALGEAYKIIQRGEADLTALPLRGCCRLAAHSRRTAAHEHASRPCDKPQDGFVMAEGAGALVL